MKTNYKVLLAILGIFLVAAGCGKQANQQNSQSANQQNTQSVSSIPTDDKQAAQATSSPQPKKMVAPVAEIKLAITVSQTVQGSNLNKPSYEFTEGQTALDLLKSTHTVETKTFNGVGEFVESIDGNKADSKHFWEFMVNGKSSNVGASSYKLKAGDSVEWRLTEIK